LTQIKWLAKLEVVAIPADQARHAAQRRPMFQGSDDLHVAMRAWGRQQGALANEGSRFFMDIDLTMAQFRALMALRIAGKLTGKDLAARLKVTPATLIPLLDRLEAQGYVRRVPDLVDRRLTWIELTQKAYRMFLRMWAGSQAKMLRAIRQLSPADRSELSRLLNQVADLLEG
jgi:DNA-binding MarR family transcriptional regulator